jgi:acyl carrier protein
MTIATRTPEGLPFGCPICGQVANLEPSYPAGDAVCPACGSLLWWFRDYLGRTLAIESAAIKLETGLRDLGLDALDQVEMVMELEERFDLAPVGNPGPEIETVRDLLCWARTAPPEGDVPDATEP